MERIACSVWSNGTSGWGLKVLGGPEIRRSHFNASRPTIVLLLDDVEAVVNIAKKSFWTRTWGELIKKEIDAYVKRRRLAPCDRVWLRVIEPGGLFAVELS